jgi:predicted ATPase/DNA-binding CsgD family transcriptional regulator
MLGREHEVASLVARVRQPDVRLLTLTGPGGVGKTRLALAIAAALTEDFPDGVSFVTLASIAHSDLVAPAVAHVLEVREAAHESLIARLQAVLRERRLLLVLDNYEHVLEAAPLVTNLLSAARDLRILVTSRTRLRLSGEHEHVVPPLALVDPGEHVSREAVAESPAVQLFVARARAVQDVFALTEENAAAVAAICRALDGLPLAIELAAARVKVLPPSALLARLEHRLPLLTGGGRDLPARQQTMRDTIAWSYGLLSEPEQRLFRRLAIFVGGGTVEAAEAIANARGDLGIDPFDGITSLVEKSLLHRGEGPDGEPRFSMLETVREYGLELLAASGEEAEVRDRHAAWSLDLMERYWVDDASWLEDPSWLTRVEPDQDNVRAALVWLERTGDGVGLLRLAGATQPYWEVRGHGAEAVAWLERGLERGQDAPPQVRFRALGALGRNLTQQGAYARATGVHEAQLALAREHGDALWEAGALYWLGLAALNQERYDEATPLIEEAMTAFRQLGDEGGVCGGRYCSGVIAYGQGDLVAAATHLEAALAWRRDRGSVMNLTVPLNAVALVACDQGDHRAATALLAEGLTRWEDDGSGNREVLAEWLAAVARLAACRGRPETAGLLYGAAEALYEAIGQPLLVPPRSVYRRHVDTLRDTLGAEAFAATWADGRVLLLEQAIEEARAVTADPVAEAAGGEPRRRGAGASFTLTAREGEVLSLLAHGKTDREIGELLFISRRTVNAHVASILSHLDVHSRQDAVARAVALGLLHATPDTSRYT